MAVMAADETVVSTLAGAATDQEAMGALIEQLADEVPELQGNPTFRQLLRLVRQRPAPVDLAAQLRLGW